MPSDDMPPNAVRGRYLEGRRQNVERFFKMPSDGMPPNAVRGGQYLEGGK